MNTDELSKRLWTVADAIVAFVTLQEVTFAFLVIQRSDPLPGLTSGWQKLLAAGLLAGVFLAYGWAAWWLGNRSMTLIADTSDLRIETMQKVNWARVLFILWIGGMTILLVFWDLIEA